ncbi:MAG: hypothetical protein ABR602_09325, partial [Gemmatimonadales bacterium]
MTTGPAGGAHFPQPGEPEWLRLVLSQSSPIARPGAAPPPLPGPVDGYRAMASLVPDPVVVVDYALRIAVVNQPFLRLIGASSAAALIGRSV